MINFFFSFKRLQKVKGYISNNLNFHNDWWSLKKATGLIRGQFTNNNTIVGVYSNEDKMVHQSAYSSVKPVKSDQPSEHDFFGDAYAIDDDIPQTVSVLVFIFVKLYLQFQHFSFVTLRTNSIKCFISYQ